MDEAVTYSDLNFMTLEQAKNQRSQKGKSKASISYHWRPAAVTLGIFCLGLLGAAVTLSIMVMQATRTVSSQNKNLTAQKEILETLLKKLNILQALNLNLSGTIHRLSSDKAPHCSPCPERWHQRGDNCYLFSTNWNTWKESKAMCRTLNSSLLKIQSKDELTFIQDLAQAYNSFWIGLFRSKIDGPWLWEDNSTFSNDLFNIPKVNPNHYPICVSMNGGNVIVSDCLAYRFCICQKRPN